MIQWKAWVGGWVGGRGYLFAHVEDELLHLFLVAGGAVELCDWGGWVGGWVNG